jgi:hypothetical protein
MSDPAKKSRLVWVTTAGGFRLPSGAVNPTIPPRRGWDVLTGAIHAPPKVTSPWPGGKPM